MITTAMLSALLPFQREPAQAIADCINSYYITGVNRGVLIVQPAGTGKTYEVTAAVKGSQQSRQWLPPTYIPSKNRFFDDECIPSKPREGKPATVMVVTPAQVKTQFTRVMASWGVTNFIVTSPMSLTTAYGDAYLKWVSVMRRGEIHLDPVWDTELMPDVILLDEAQCVKNKNAAISQIILAFINQGGLVIPISATPFTKLSETYVICRALGILGPAEDHYSRMSEFIHYADDYNDYSPTAMRRFNGWLVTNKLKVEAHNIKFPHRVFNKCVLIQFKSPAHKKIYLRAYADWVEECQRQNRNTPEGIAAIWAAMLKFRQAAELLRAEQMCELAVDKVVNGKKQVLIASNFVATLEQVRDILVKIHKIPLSKISIIVGGQNAWTRQENIDKFQRGDADYCLLTLKSGGAGLSLHHEKDYPKAKPRYCILPPTWSAIELVQLLGRAHRITSISTTYQDIIWYAGTIEEDVAVRVQRKMRSMKEIVSKRETWHDLLTPSGEFAVEVRQKLIEAQEETTAEGDNIIDSMALEAYDNEDEGTQN